MRLLGSQPSHLRRLLPWLLGLAVFGLVAAGGLWARQQEVARRVAEARADAANAQLAQAQASITALVRAQAVASATALAQANEPGPALERALGLVLAAFQDPTEGRLKALSDAFTPAALALFQREMEHLVSANLRLGGQSGFELTILDISPPVAGADGADRLQVRTRERWTYDERDQAGARARCLREEGEQTYTMRRRPTGWLVEDAQLGTTRRLEC